MSRLSTRLRREWDEFVGPEATRTNTVVTLSGGAAALLAAPRLARRRGAGRGAAAVIALLAVDLAGGVYVNNTRACARWYERPGQGASQHLTFAAWHVHPALVGCVDSAAGRQQHALRWASAHYAYLMLATTVIRAVPERRRSLGVTLTAGGLALDRVLGPSHTAPWFAWAYYPKLLLGHAAAALWSDAALHSEAELQRTPP